jgi:hypothetical protein
MGLQLIIKAERNKIKNIGISDQNVKYFRSMKAFFGISISEQALIRG